MHGGWEGNSAHSAPCGQQASLPLPSQAHIALACRWLWYKDGQPLNTIVPLAISLKSASGGSSAQAPACACTRRV